MQRRHFILTAGAALASGGFALAGTKVTRLNI
jgi:hypothetical protein